MARLCGRGAGKGGSRVSVARRLGRDKPCLERERERMECFLFVITLNQVSVSFDL